MIKVFEKYPDNIGGVTGSPIIKKVSPLKKFLLFISGTISFIFLLPGRLGNGKFQASGCTTVISNNIKAIAKAEFLYGFSMAFKREVFMEFLLDEYFHGYVWNDDDDLAYRVSRKYQGYFTPFAKILHNQPRKTLEKVDPIAKKKKVEYHYYFYKKNLPQDFKHKIAFYWSIVGFFVTETINGVIKRDLGGVKGLFIGLREILKKDRVNEKDTK